ncbi:hypothetical protein MUG91_G199n8 [Manis pentadactyla]|nr:hypothetical protein MUG91_G199n8 [Manis pentadactyla]
MCPVVHPSVFSDHVFNVKLTSGPIGFFFFYVNLNQPTSVVPYSSPSVISYQHKHTWTTLGSISALKC